jgi:hypothetical protein
MADNKNQHYVPRIHLKPFTLNMEGNAISLYSSARKLVIHNAPVKNQCSRDYYYGRDLGLEKKLAELEGCYGDAVRKVVDAGRQRPTVPKAWLRTFWAMQWARTLSAAEDARQMAQGMVDEFDLPSEFAVPPEPGWVMVPLRAFPEVCAGIEDLSCVILRNYTSAPFITSDNPAVMTNKFHLFDRRVGIHTSGLNSAGLLLFLPLTPTHLAVFYDRDLYSIDQQNGWCDLRTEADVMAVNQHQVLNCAANVYFSRDLPWSWIPAMFDELQSERAKPRWQNTFAVLHSDKDGVETYRVIANANVREHRRAVIMTRSIAPEPTRWPGFLRWRARGWAFDSGTAMGIVRRRLVRANPLQRFRVLRTNM